MKNSGVEVLQELTRSQDTTIKSLYALYLQTDTWRQIRVRVFQRDSYKCYACGCNAECVHHRAYDAVTIRGSDLSRLVSLCNSCHQAIEFDEQGKKRTRRKANKALSNRAKRRRRRLNGTNLRFHVASVRKKKRHRNVKMWSRQIVKSLKRRSQSWDSLFQKERLKQHIKRTAEQRSKQ